MKIMKKTKKDIVSPTPAKRKEIKEIEKAYPESYRLARRFHGFYEQSASAFGYKTKKETKEFDPESPNGRLMAWVCYEIVKEEKQRILATAKDHYWDSVSKDKEIIIKHLESILGIYED